MGRNNDQWLADLRLTGAKLESALHDLRGILFRNLHKALSNRNIDDSFVEDAVQDSLIQILDRLHQFEGRSHFLTWATAIAIRVAMGELRRSRWKDVSLNELMSESSLGPKIALDTELAPDTVGERQSVIDSMLQIIENQLTEKQRTALLAELKGMPLDEIARHLNSNRNAIYKLTHDARKSLKNGLDAAGYTAEDVIATFEIRG